jgi:thymidylate synthase
MFISGPTLDDLLRRVLGNLMNKGDRVKATRGEMKELTGVALRLTNPRARLSHTEKKGKVFSGLGELAWYLAKSNDAGFISYYIKQYEKEAEENNTIYGAYGPRLFDKDGNNQVQNVINLLRKSPSSRKAVIQLFNSSDLVGKHKDVPCTCSLQFLVRSESLDMIVFMRSNDAYWGLSHDFFSFTMIQEILARILGFELGTYTHFVGSLHLYDKHTAHARKYLDEGWQPTENVAMPPMPIGDPMPSIEVFLQAEDAIRKGLDPGIQVEGLDPYWQDLVRLLQIFTLFKKSKREQIAKIKKKMAHRVYNSYIAKKE